MSGTTAKWYLTTRVAPDSTTATLILMVAYLKIDMM
jgi:hypothetical protein